VLQSYCIYLGIGGRGLFGGGPGQGGIGLVCAPLWLQSATDDDCSNAIASRVVCIKGIS